MTHCPSDVALSRSIGDVASFAIEAHLVRCAKCRSTRDAFSRAISLARELPVATPRAQRIEELRTAVIASGGTLARGSSEYPAAPARRRSARATLVACAVGTALAFVCIAPHRAAPEPDSIVAVHGQLSHLEADASPVRRAVHETAPPPAPRSGGSQVARPPAATRAPSGDELAYNDGWTALRAGDFARAANELASIRDAALLEDAMYWRAIALARADRTVDAVVTLERFGVAYPDSAHAPRARAVLARLRSSAREF